VKLLVSRAATADIERLREFLYEKNPAAAERAISALLGAVNSLRALPDRGRQFGDLDVRQLTVRVGGSSYVLRYRHDVAREEVVVLRVWHGREARP